MTSGSFCIVSDTLVIYIIQLQRLYFGETGVCSMCCQKLVIAQKYSAEVRWNFGTCSAPSAKTLANIIRACSVQL